MAQLLRISPYLWSLDPPCFPSIVRSFEKQGETLFWLRYDEDIARSNYLKNILRMIQPVIAGLPSLRARVSGH